MTFVLLLLAAFALSCAFTGLIRAYALRRGMLDVPNERSSHETPTPRGGGLALVLLVLVAVAGFWIVEPQSGRLWAALLGGTFVAAIGWWDDKRSLPAQLRFLVHGVAAAWAVIALGGLPSLRLGTAELMLGGAGIVLAWLFIVWLINLYNFMDGIDGLAGGEAMIVAGVAALLCWSVGLLDVARFAAILAAASAGFLLWNLPPARVFMGDVGSGFLGYVFAVLALYSETGSGPPLLAWTMLLGVFLIDATATLLRRMAAGERWFQAHRDHAYQRVVNSGFSHSSVTLVVWGLSLLLGAGAWLAVSRPSLGLPLAGLAFATLLALWTGVLRATPDSGASDRRPKP